VWVGSWVSSGGVGLVGGGRDGAEAGEAAELGEVLDGGGFPLFGEAAVFEEELAGEGIVAVAASGGRRARRHQGRAAGGDLPSPGIEARAPWVRSHVQLHPPPDTQPAQVQPSLRPGSTSGLLFHCSAKQVTSQLSFEPLCRVPGPKPDRTTARPAADHPVR
jgi:hypothetical protein